MSTDTLTLPDSWRARWQQRRDRWLTNPRFREAAARFVGTRPVARQRASELFDLVAGFVYSQWLAACVELDLFERLARGPLTARVLAQEGRLPDTAALRLLEAAVSLKLVQTRGQDARGCSGHGAASPHPLP
ncbi:MAG: hypothetical protein LW854_20740 [Rubrivivax sp.]|nr:hypothetical protein [Rubrivivax sp.]